MVPATDEGATRGNAIPGRGSIDTAAPFESVKAAVSKFGGIVDWKAHKAQTVERHKQVQVNLDKTQEEIEHYQSQSEAAEKEKAHVLKDLESTRRLVEELKLSLEKAETEETQAKQDSELALLRVREMQQGIVGDESVADKAELDIAKSRHAFAVAELKSVKNELDASREEYSTLLRERDVAIENATQAVSKSRDIERKVEELSLDIITVKETLESAHVAHMEAEEHRINASLAKGKDALDWEKKFRQVEDEIQQLNERIEATRNLQNKVDTASATLLSLKSEFTGYMEAKSNESGDAKEGDEQKDTTTRALSETEKELEEIKHSIEKAKEDVKCLQVATASLKAELAGEEATVASMKEKEGVRIAEVSSLESELSRIEMEIELLQAKEKETQRQLEKLPESLQQANLEAEEAKSSVNLANEELIKAREEAEQAREAANSTESRLKAALREIDTAKASERLAFDAIKALEESEKAARSDVDNSQSGVTLPLEEYYALSKKAHDAEEQANNKVADATSMVEEAKKSEARSLVRLAEATRRLEERKESLRLAVEKADNANDGKLAVEQELREWRAVGEQRRKAGNDTTTDESNPSAAPRKRSDGRRDTKSMDMQQESPTAIRRAHSAKMDVPVTKDGRIVEPKKKKKSFFPRIVMFLARKKAHSAK